MPGYISEFNYYGLDSEEFVEIAIPAGTDASSYEIYIYQADGTIFRSFPLGSPVATMSGQDIYLIDAATPSFDSGGDPTGMFYPDDAIALYDGSSVLQFVSWGGNTIVGAEGPANGMASTSVGTITAFGNSLQSDNGGVSYYEQTADNPGSIPACYGPGTLIATPQGARRVETLKVGDALLDETGYARKIVWVWSGDEPLEGSLRDAAPVLIAAHALGLGRPSADLIVSPQHRILLGGDVLAPAKALTSLKGVRRMRGKTSITWYHFACEKHHIVTANGAQSESLLLGPMVVKGLPRRERLRLYALFGRKNYEPLNGPAARRCLTVRQARAWIKQAHRPASLRA